MAWFDQYLFKTGPPANEAFKKGSPLDVALERGSIHKLGNAYGVEFRPPSIPENPPPSFVIPEVVQHGDLEVGRFEVTRAQYAAFDKTYKFAPGTENYPANAISFEKAKAYAAWLADMTAETFRLPTEEEGAKLYVQHAGENTLDYWAGYALNPEDARRLEAKVGELNGATPLLKEVGSFSPAGGDGEALGFRSRRKRSGMGDRQGWPGQHNGWQRRSRVRSQSALCSGRYSLHRLSRGSRGARRNRLASQHYET